jgi:hypothetical protein
VIKVVEKHVDGVTSGPSLAVVFSLLDESESVFVRSGGRCNSLACGGKGPIAHALHFVEGGTLISITATASGNIRSNPEVGGYRVVLVKVNRSNGCNALICAMHDVALTCIVEACAVRCTR